MMNHINISSSFHTAIKRERKTNIRNLWSNPSKENSAGREYSLSTSNSIALYLAPICVSNCLTLVQYGQYDLLQPAKAKLRYNTNNP